MRVLAAVSRGRRLDRAFAGAARGLPPRDRAWLQEAAYGTVRFRGRIDHLLELHLRRRLDRLPPAVRETLRLGAYQLLYMGGVPSYAAVSESVELARREGGAWAARLVNGVLRSLEREGGGAERFPDPEEDPAGHLSTWGSHPRWLVERWLGRWSVEAVRRLTEVDNEVPSLCLRPLGMGVEEARARLEEEGIRSGLVGRGTGCLALEAGTEPATVLGRVPGVIQDPGAALVTLYADPPAEAWVADLCAAPGGKALALADGAPYVLAADPSRPRLVLLRENRDRLRARVGIVQADARRPPLREAPFVLLDVPCTGTGTLRRHPDARWRVTPDGLDRLVSLQREILDGAAAVVPPGGILVYATCSLEREENEDQVEAFLHRHGGTFRVEDTAAVEAAFRDPEGRLRVLPHETGFDGAFAARLRRVA